MPKRVIWSSSAKTDQLDGIYLLYDGVYVQTKFLDFQVSEDKGTWDIAQTFCKETY